MRRRMIIIPTPLRLKASSSIVCVTFYLLSGCAGTEVNVRRGLINAGLSPDMATCMARPMTEKLTVRQLMQLNSLGKVGLQAQRTENYDALIERIRAMRDPQILRVTTAAAIDCAFG